MDAFEILEKKENYIRKTAYPEQKIKDTSL
jgi:hypothetical protein